MHPVLKVAGVVHIWYYIPLCTIFTQQFNGGVFRTQFHLSKSRSQNPMPMSKEDFLAHQYGNQKTIQGSQPPSPAGVGLAISCRIILRAIRGGYTSFQSVVKASIISILLGQLNWSLQASINQPVCTWPNWANSFSTAGIQSHNSNFKTARSVLTQFRQYSQ
ncbi:hypothetical protein O181_062505 [Austropuccinia psidii MF-1]|uniref:Uncharacterized protein n=1 Tax=Austropuccinia psidii MF-1 TaxID=1389203 RepID=A0A9Q3I1E2_9BASI|nr:hypothetical protein [Austropuccinia psidii MF-1]